MVITISGRHLEITPSIRTYAEERVNKLTKYYDLIQEIEVILDGRADKQKKVDIVINAEHKNTFVATVEGEDLYACIDAASHKLERQLTDHKDKHRNRKHPGE